MREVRYKDTGRSLLLKAFGNTPKLRIIDIFLTNPYFDFDKEELARELGMSKQTVYKNFKDLEELGVVKVSRKIGRATMYRIDRDYPLIRTLNESLNEASLQIAKQERKQRIPLSATT
jgi:predicted transcriptional regulator